MSTWSCYEAAHDDARDAPLHRRAGHRRRDRSRACAAAEQAPSGGNIQPWQFLVVADADARAAVGALYQRAFDRYERAARRTLAAVPATEDEAPWTSAAATRRATWPITSARRRRSCCSSLPDISLTPRRRRGRRWTSARPTRRSTRPCRTSCWPRVWAGDRDGAHDRHPSGARRDPGRGCSIPDTYEVAARADGPAGRTVRGGPPQAGGGPHPLGHLRQPPPLSSAVSSRTGGTTRNPPVRGGI